MDEGYANLPTSHLLGSVPAVTQDERKPGAPVAQVVDAAATSRLQEFPPAPGGNGGGYRPPGAPADGDVENQANWKGYFNVASYAPYFNVDTDVVVDRLVSSVYPMDGFYRKIDANPDMYGPLWITTTLIFMLAAFGNFATYLMQKKKHLDIWNFDVGYFNWAASVMYGYAIVVPAVFFFLFQYFGSRPSLVRFWCMWGYSLFVFIPASLEIRQSGAGSGLPERLPVVASTGGPRLCSPAPLHASVRPLRCTPPPAGRVFARLHHATLRLTPARIAPKLTLACRSLPVVATIASRS